MGFSLVFWYADAFRIALGQFCADFFPCVGDLRYGCCIIAQVLELMEGRGSLTLKTACREMGYLFGRSREVGEYQQRLVALLAEVCQRPTVSTAMATDLICLPKNLGHTSSVLNCHYLFRDFHFWARMPGLWGVFSGWQNVEMFIVLVLDRRNYYCKVPVLWAQDETPVLPFVTTSLIMTYYSGLAMRTSVDDKTFLWMRELNEYVFMTGALFVVSDRDGSPPQDYKLNRRFDNLSRAVLFRLSDNILVRWST